MESEFCAIIRSPHIVGHQADTQPIAGGLRGFFALLRESANKKQSCFVDVEKKDYLCMWADSTWVARYRVGVDISSYTQNASSTVD